MSAYICRIVGHDWEDYECSARPADAAADYARSLMARDPSWSSEFMDGAVVQIKRPGSIRCLEMTLELDMVPVFRCTGKREIGMIHAPISTGKRETGAP